MNTTVGKLDIDFITIFLARVNLSGFETEFRSIEETLCTSFSDQTARWVIAYLATIMHAASFRWPVIMKTVDNLRCFTPDELADSTLAVINGSVIVLPQKDGGIKTYNLYNLQEIEKPPECMVTAVVYYIAAMFKHVNEVADAFNKMPNLPGVDTGRLA